MRREEIQRFWDRQLRFAGAEHAYRHDPTFHALAKQGFETLCAADELLNRLDLPLEDWQRRWFVEQMAEKLLPSVSEAERRLVDHALAVEKEKYRRPGLIVLMEPPERVNLPLGPVGEVLKPGVIYTWPRTETFKRWYEEEEA